MRQASNSLLTFHLVCSAGWSPIRALPKVARLGVRFLMRFHLHPAASCVGHLGSSQLPRFLIRLRFGEGSVRSLLMLVLISFATCPTALAGMSIAVDLRSEALLSTPQVRLGDISLAECLAGCPDIDLPALALAPSPALNTVYSWDRDHVRSLLEAVLGAPQVVRFTGALAVQLTLKGRPVQAEEVSPLIRAHIAQATGWDEAEIEVKSVDNLEGVELPPGKITFRIPQKPSPADFRRLVIRFEAFQEEQLVSSFWVTADARVHATVWQAARSLPRGRILAMEDIKPVPLEITDARIRYVRDREEAVGNELRRSLSAGDPVTRDVLTAPILVRSGDTVELKLERPGITVSSLARAEQQGRLGQMIKIRNLDFPRSVHALVTGRNEVTVP